MSVDTGTVQGRRELNSGSLDEVVADAEKLVASAINGSIDGTSAKAPWLVRLLGPLMKGRVLVLFHRIWHKTPGWLKQRSPRW